MVIRNYFQRAGDYIVNVLNEIREHGLIRGYEGLSAEEIAKRMMPVPEESIRHLLPVEFARNVRLIIERDALRRK